MMPEWLQKAFDGGPEGIVVRRGGQEVSLGELESLTARDLVGMDIKIRDLPLIFSVRDRYELGHGPKHYACPLPQPRTRLGSGFLMDCSTSTQGTIDDISAVDALAREYWALTAYLSQSLPQDPKNS